MQVDIKYPQAYVFTEAELNEVSNVLQQPVVSTFLRSLEADCLVGKHDVRLTGKDFKDVSYEIVANEAYVQGQLHMLRRLRSLKQVKKSEATGEA